MKKIKKLYNIINNFCYYNFNKYRLNLIKQTFKYKPYDYGYMLDILKQMSIYNEHFYKSKHCWSVEGIYVERDMKLLTYLINVLTDNIDLFTYENNKYKCLINVNFKNIDRFCNNAIYKKYLYDHPEDLYIIKARHLFSKLIYYRLPYWWD